MFKKNSLFRFLKSSSSTGPFQADSASVQELVNKEKIAILSASCCDASMQAVDEQLLANLSIAMNQIGVERQVVFSTITSTRQQLRDIGTQGSDDIKQFKENLTSIFQGQGLAAFPILMLGGKIVFYGGVPSVELITQKLL